MFTCSFYLGVLTTREFFFYTCTIFSGANNIILNILFYIYFAFVINKQKIPFIFFSYLTNSWAELMVHPLAACWSKRWANPTKVLGLRSWALLSSTDPNVYIGWEAKAEQIFNVYKVQEDQKIKLASLEFVDYAMQWWHKNVMDIGLNKRSIVVTWDDLKDCMHVQFVPPHYRKELLLKLQRLQQGPRSVDEYIKDLETTLTKINMHDGEQSKIARFVSGLRREIQDIVELYEYSSLLKLVHLANKGESQLLKKTNFKNIDSDGFYKSSWKDKNKISSKTFPSKFSKETTSNHRVFKPSTSTSKSPTKTSNTKCCKCLGFGHRVANCPSNRTMMVKGMLLWVTIVPKPQGLVPLPPTSSRSQSEDKYVLPFEGDFLVVRCMLGHILKPFDESQRENIFHTRCLINEKLCSLIVDGGSCTNVASTRVVEKLGLSTISHA